EYQEIEKFRFELLNLKYTLKEKLPVKEMGSAAIVSFYSHATHSISTSLVDNVPVCEVHFSEQECFQFVAEPENNHIKFLETDLIMIDSDTLNAIDNPVAIAPAEDAESPIELTEIEDEEVTADIKANSSVATDEIESKGNSTIAIGDSDSATTTEQSSAVEHKEKPKTEPVIQDKTSHSIKILVGHTQSGHREVVFEPNNTKMVSHPNMGVIGTMGTGKTQFARSVIAQFAKEGVNNVGGKPVGILVFDYKGDYKDKEFLNAVGGTCYKFNYPFNPLKLVVNDEVEGMNLPAITADRIADSFAKAYGLGLKQQNNIKQVIIDTYKDAGITKDPSSWENPVPTMEQVIEKYFETYDANDKAFALFDKLRDYTIFTTDNSNCVSLFEWLNSVRVIDLTLYPDDTKKVI
ncbi:MAG: ATP-binding protein, partial [Prevotella sp.]|nr:ATP-binding protein [Prevotella sp.]